MLVPVQQDLALGAAGRQRFRPLLRVGSIAAAITAAAVVVVTVLHYPLSLRDVVLALVWASVWIGAGTLVLLRGAPTPMGLLFGCMMLANGVATPVSNATAGTPDAWIGRTLIGLALTLSVLALSVFPEGRFVSHWLVGVTVGFGLWQLFVAVVGTSGTLLDVLGGVVFFVGFGAPVLVQVGRYRRDPDPARRAQTKWVVYGVCTFLAVELVVSLPYFAPAAFPDLVRPGSTYDDFQSVVSFLAVLVVPVCITIAMLVGNLFDVDLVISRTLVYAILSLAVAGGYLGIVGAVGFVVGSQSTRAGPLVAATVIAVLFGPLRARLQSRVRRLVYGLRAEPYEALTELGRQLATSTPEDDVPARLVSTIRRTLRVPYVAVAVGDDSGFPVTAESGSPAPHRLALPVLHQGEQVGMLLVGHDERSRLSPADRSLLVDLCSQAGGALHAVQLRASLRRGAAQLQSAREQLVLAREEERRRLRRELHDGLAPTLAAAGLTAATASDLTRRDPLRSGRLLDELQETLKVAVGDIRALVDGLRPPALDELGLIAALRERVSGLGAALAVQVCGPDELPSLPAAVEVAAYRICQEALMNVLKHSGARYARVVITVEDGLTLVVEDDGSGLGHEHPEGVGLASMRERSEELGGRCTIEEAATGGTRVSVWLPLQVPASSTP